MATGYLKNSEDLDEICESRYKGTLNPDFSGYFYNGSTPMTSRYQQPSIHKNGSYLMLEEHTGYSVNNAPIVTAKKGYFPCDTQFDYIYTPGVYKITRGEDSEGEYLKVGSTYFRGSDFRGNKVPHTIGVVLVGAGGGGGGVGYDKGGLWGYNVDAGGGGAGGGVVSAVVEIEFDPPYGFTEYQVTIGKGGAAGSNGSTSSRPSNGTAGNLGGHSYFKGYYYDEGSHLVNFLIAYGGGGGLPGKGDTERGNGGQGGSGYINTNRIENGLVFNGGDGGTPNGNASSGAFHAEVNFVWEDYNTPFSTITRNRTGKPSSYETRDSYRSTYAGGGSSWGYGGTGSTAGPATGPSLGGGGCATGYGAQDGASGAIYLYY